MHTQNVGKDCLLFSLFFRTAPNQTVPWGNLRSYLSPPQVLMLAAESVYPTTWP